MTTEAEVLEKQFYYRKYGDILSPSEKNRLGSERFYNTAIPDPNIERIHHLRRLVLVHSIIYYKYDENIVPDSQYDAWARELARLQKEHPEAARQVWYMQTEFENFSESVSGFDLPIHSPAENVIAEFLLAARSFERRPS